MVCRRHVGIGVLIIALSACHPTVAKSTRTASRVKMDSATVERLCVHPDSVRAGLIECVLQDQSQPPGKRLERVSPPKP